MIQTKARTLVRYVLPTMLSSICFFLFTIIDGIFVGRGVGTNALGAVNLTLPCVMGVYALLMLTTIGGVTIIAIRLGRGDAEGANQAFMHAVGATLVISAVLSLAGVLFSGQLSRLMGANNTFWQMTKDYIFWYSVFLIPDGMDAVLSGMCRNDGSPGLVTVATVISTSVNVIGDWFLIFPMQMGVAGAAIATGTSQTISLLIILPHFLRRRGKLRFKRCRVSAVLLRKIIVRGLPESIAQLSAPVTTLCMNYVLKAQLGDIGINTFSIISYVASFSVAVFYGTSEGLQPLIGRSYGAKQPRDLNYFFHAGIIINIVGSLIINLVLLAAGGSICTLFGADEQTLAATIRCMPLYACGFILMAPNVMITAYFYSTKRSRQAICISVLRSLVANSIVITILPRLFGSGVIWFTMCIYEAIVLVIAIIMLRRSESGGVDFH